MPISPIQFRPGINRELTNYANKGGFYDGNNIRFRSGLPEKLGGWVNAYGAANTFVGVGRTLWTWTTSDGDTQIAMGTNQKYYLVFNGVYNDITPLAFSVNFPFAPITGTLTNPFTTVAGSNAVTVTDSTTPLLPGTYVTFSGATSVGGLTLTGSYEVITSSGSSYTIYSPTAATSSATSVGSVTATYQINAGYAGSSASTGWGTNPWGTGGWGVASSNVTSNPIRLWSQGNFGDNLVMAYRNGPIFYWQYANDTYNPAQPIQYVADQNIKTTQTVAANATASTTFTVINAQGIDIGAQVTGTGIPANTYVTSSYTGYTTIVTNNAVTVTAGQSVNFSYSGNTAPNEVGQVLVSSTNQFVIALGSTPYNPANFSPAYLPMLVRWTDQSIPYEWTPTQYNQSGSQILPLGSYIVGGLNTRTETLIWTDRALYSMQYIGAPYVFGFTLMMDNISIISQNCMITVNGMTYWMGRDKFYMYNGTVVPLPCTVRKYVFSNLNTTYDDSVVCGQNEQFNEIWWFYTSNASTTNDSYVIYNYLENLWYYGTMNRTGWTNISTRVNPLGILSVQNTYLPAALTATPGANQSIPVINAYAYPSSGTIQIGSEQISYTSISGNTLNGCTRGVNGTTVAAHAAYSQTVFTVPNQILYHEYGVDDGSVTPAQPITAYLQTADFDINGGDHFGFVSRILPDFTFYGSISGSPQVTLSVIPRNSAGSPYLNTVDTSYPGGPSGSGTPVVTGTQPPPTYPNTYPVEQYTGQLYTRVRGRQMAFYVYSNGLGVAWQMGTQRFDMRPDGRR